MQAKEKLKEVEYFLIALRRTSQNPEEFNYNLSAFLSALRSVPEFMLYDFADRYSLSFTREDYLTDDIFAVAAKVLRRQDVLDFLNSWRQNLGRLNQNSLFRKRVRSVHRGYPPLVYDYAVNTSGTITSRFFQEPTSIIRDAPANPTIFPAANPSPRFEIQFPDFPNQNALDVCQDTFNEVRGFVETAERDYWPKP